MITISVNGENKQIPKHKHLLDAINDWQYTSKKFAIAINGKFIPKSSYTDTVLQDGDDLELLIPMQGG